MEEEAPYVPENRKVKLVGKGMRLAFIEENNEIRNHAVNEQMDMFKEWF